VSAGHGRGCAVQRRRAMLRGCVTALVMSILAAVLGTGLILVGLVHPSQRLVAVASVIWARAILLSAGVRLTIEGSEGLNDAAPRFFVGNHQSALDIPILIVALRGRVRFMAKDSLFRIPIFGWVLLRYGYTPIDRSNARLTLRTLDRMLDRLERRPVSFAAFPEGTRSPDGRLLPFRMGTMKVCQRSGFPVVPFSIDGSLAVHDRSKFAVRPGAVRLVFGEPIPADQVASMSTSKLHQRVAQTVARQLGRTYEPTPLHEGAWAATEGS